MQRSRALEAYNDLEARYERRPSLWVEPVGRWGAGSVQLLEIPTDDETGDHIAAFWRPKAAWRAGRPVALPQRLHSGGGSPPPAPAPRVLPPRGTRRASGWARVCPLVYVAVGA